ncbi:NUDIX hydrolase [Nonomuraea jiangxiensis]|uniref:NUDIX hydrolase n=1 Tax=Nonomuraea jiangxiensis TaxID=633440 RepID=UPI000B8638F6|nr:NUDIX domain-containing protein [Nonomuraea jiangxiensis]
MAISDVDISSALSAYLERHPGEAGPLSEPVQLLSQGSDFASRRNFPMHVTVSALLVRGAEILLVEHRAYGILLQPGGHLEPTDATLIGASVRELAEETGVDPGKVFPASPIPVYIEYGRVPARPAKDEPDHYHLDIGFAFVTDADVGRIQESEVRGAAWYPLAEAERLVGRRIGRAVSAPARGALWGQ